MSSATATVETPPAASGAFKRGLFGINFKFAFLMGGLLFALLVVVTLVVYEQTRVDLTREVAERGNTVAVNLAAKLAEPLVQDDELTLVQLLKDSVEESVPAAPASAGFWQNVLDDLAFGRANQAVKNEGIERIVVRKDPKEGALDGGPVFFDSKRLRAMTLAELGEPLPVSAADPEGLEPFPIFSRDGRDYYDIVQPIVEQGSRLGEMRLFLRRDVVTVPVRTATTRLVAVMLASLVLGIAVLSLVVRLLLRPVKDLVRGVNAVAAGDFNVQIRIKRGDELGDLIESYNGMAKNLKEKEAVQEALAKYTSKDLVNQMLSDKAKLTLGGQRVHATIFFSVVRGMHALSQTLPAEEYVALVNEFLEVKTDVIMRNGGSIDKFIGDEVMALWGLNGEDPAQMAYQAVKAGVEVQEAIGHLNKVRIGRGDQPFLVSIGINNGEVVSGNMGSSVKMDYTVLGGNVNLAARLGLVAAQGGQTIISHSVYSLVADRFQIEKLAPMQLKGIKEPVPLYWPRKALK